MLGVSRCCFLLMLANMLSASIENLLLAKLYGSAMTDAKLQLSLASMGVSSDMMDTIMDLRADAIAARQEKLSLAAAMKAAVVQTTASPIELTTTATPSIPIPRVEHGYYTPLQHGHHSTQHHTIPQVKYGHYPAHQVQQGYHHIHQVLHGHHTAPQAQQGHHPAPQAQHGHHAAPHIQQAHPPAPHIQHGHHPAPHIQHAPLVLVTEPTPILDKLVQAYGTNLSLIKMPSTKPPLSTTTLSVPAEGGVDVGIYPLAKTVPQTSLVAPSPHLYATQQTYHNMDNTIRQPYSSYSKPMGSYQPDHSQMPSNKLYSANDVAPKSASPQLLVSKAKHIPGSNTGQYTNYGAYDSSNIAASSAYNPYNSPLSQQQQLPRFPEHQKYHNPGSQQPTQPNISNNISPLSHNFYKPGPSQSLPQPRKSYHTAQTPVPTPPSQKSYDAYGPPPSQQNFAVPTYNSQPTRFVPAPPRSNAAPSNLAYAPYPNLAQKSVDNSINPAAVPYNAQVSHTVNKAPAYNPYEASQPLHTAAQKQPSAPLPQKDNMLSSIDFHRLTDFSKAFNI